MSSDSYIEIDARIGQLSDSTEQVLQRMRQIIRGEIVQDPQIMAKTLLDTLELTLEGQKTTKALLALLEARTS